MGKLTPRKDKIQESIRKPQLIFPYNGLCNFEGAAFDTIEFERDGQPASFKMLKLFINLHGDVDREGGRTKKGTEYTHELYAMNEQTTYDNARDTIDHIYYILEHFFGEEAADKLMDFDHDDDAGDSALAGEFDVWANKFVATITKAMADDQKGAAVRNNVRVTKIGGYLKLEKGKKPKTYLNWSKRFGGYLGEPDDAVEFDQREMRNNAIYTEYILGADAGTSDSASAGTTTSDDLGQLKF